MKQLERMLNQIARPNTAQVDNDPVRFARQPEHPSDQEIAGFLAACLSFGRVASFGPKIQTLLQRAGQRGGPRAWVRGFDPQQEDWISGFQYRWIRGQDLARLLGGLRDALGTTRSIGDLVQTEPGEIDLVPALSRFVHTLRAQITSDWGTQSRGLRYLLPDPAGPSAAKRLHMFTRWMVRPADGVDLGLWSHLSPSMLIVPLDTHVHRIARLVGLTQRKNADLRAAREVTAAFARFHPTDPVRYDFALAHLGISGGCRGSHVPTICGACALRPVCAQGPG